MDAATAALKKADIRALAAALAHDPALARKPQVILTAAGLARVDVFKKLAAHGADFNAVWRGYRALHSVIQGESPHGQEIEAVAERRKCLEWLLAHGADPELTGAWPPARAILVAAFGGVASFVEALRTGGARIDVFVSCALGDVRAVRRALGKDPALGDRRDNGGLTTLQCAAGSRMGRSDAAVQARLVEIAVLLLDAGADPNARTKSWSHAIDAAYLAVSARNPGILEALLARGADATEALSAAAWQEDPSLAELTLGRGARIDEALSNGLPLLNDLVRWGQFRNALWLLGRGADPNRADAKGWTAVHQAASRGNERMWRALLDGGGDPRRKDEEGRTPLDVARAKGRIRLRDAWGKD